MADNRKEYGAVKHTPKCKDFNNSLKGLFIIIICLLCLIKLTCAEVEDFTCNGACNGTCVGNLVKCYCKTSTPALTWDTSIQQFDFIKSHNTSKQGQGFRATYDNVLYSSNLTFIVNETADLNIKCINGGVQLSHQNCTVRDPGPPEKLTIHNASFNDPQPQVQLSWNNVTCSIKYLVHIRYNTTSVYSINTTSSHLDVDFSNLLNTTAVYSYTVSGIDIVGRSGPQSDQSFPFTLDPARINLSIDVSNVTNKSGSYCFVNITVTIQDKEDNTVIRPPVQYYNLSHNLTGSITYYRVDDNTWTTTEAITDQTYIVSVIPVNIFSKGIQTELHIPVVAQCDQQSNDSDGEEGGGRVTLGSFIVAVIIAVTMLVAIYVIH